jgi:hypothetical protein
VIVIILRILFNYLNSIQGIKVLCFIEKKEKKKIRKRRKRFERMFYFIVREKLGVKV